MQMLGQFVLRWVPLWAVRCAFGVLLALAFSIGAHLQVSHQNGIDYSLHFSNEWTFAGFVAFLTLLVGGYFRLVGFFTAEAIRKAVSRQNEPYSKILALSREPGSDRKNRTAS